MADEERRGPNGRIASDLASLGELSEIHRWIPGPNGIRPTAAALEKKRKLVREIESGWSSVRDYLLHTVFGKRAGSNYVGQRYAEDCAPPELPLESRFLPNDFPYQLEDATGQHWVLWYFPSGRPEELTDEAINQHVAQHLRELCGDISVAWAWYENPKMSVPDLYHVQVFWKVFS